jgi:hypothetical protein
MDERKIWEVYMQTGIMRLVQKDKSKRMYKKNRCEDSECIHRGERLVTEA